MCTFVSFVSFANTCDTIREDVFRLHVLANSDSDFDQQVKIQVRDAILEASPTLFSDTGNKEEAMEEAAAQTTTLTMLANTVLQQSGSTDTAQVQVCKMYFSTRVYEHYTLPAGYYDALRITIGQGAGQNWWCVLYPNLCVPAATTEQAEEALTEDQLNVMENSVEYEFSFALVELWEELQSVFEEVPSQ